jgi:DNA primase catalytic subunit
MMLFHRHKKFNNKETMGKILVALVPDRFWIFQMELVLPKTEIF